MNKISLTKLLEITAEATGVDIPEIIGKRRDEYITEARCLFCTLARREWYRLIEIGNIIGVNHSVVLYHLRRHENRMSTDKYYHRCYNNATLEIDKINENIVIEIEEKEIETSLGIRVATIITKYYKHNI